jgi:uncharacterized protein YcbK (DUF882 family)
VAEAGLRRDATAVFWFPDHGLSGDSLSRDGNRTLKLYFIHTKERAEITFKRNGRYDQAA